MLVEVHSTKAVAARAVDLCAVLLAEDATAESVARVLRAHGEQEPITLTGDDLRAMRRTAARLVEVLAAPGTGEAAALLNRLLADSGPPRLTDHEGTTGWHLHTDSHDDAPWDEWFRASSAMAFAVLLADQQRVPGGLCASPSCRRPYLHVGGGSPRRYCSSRCATRERVAAYRSARA